MDHINIPVPDGLTENRKADLIGWLTDLAHRAANGTPAIDQDDDDARDQVAQRIKDGMKDIEAGRFVDSDQARSRLDKKLGIDRPA